MKEIELTKGKVALVSDGDFKELSKWKWFASFSGRSWVILSDIWDPKKKNQLSIVMARLIKGLKYKDGKYVDHRNGNTFDNRRSNLRVCTNSQNLMNRGAPKNNTSGFKGVSFNKYTGKWVANIVKNYRQIHLGYYKDKKNAAKAYNKAAFKLFGKFAYLNKVGG